MLTALPFFPGSGSKVLSLCSALARAAGQKCSLDHSLTIPCPFISKPKSIEPGQVPGTHSDPCGPRSPALTPDKQRFMVSQCMCLEWSLYHRKGQHCSGLPTLTPRGPSSSQGLSTDSPADGSQHAAHLGHQPSSIFRAELYIC